MSKKELRKDGLLKLIYDMGGEGTRAKINEKISVYWELRDEELEIEKGTNKPLYWHHVSGVCQSLKDKDDYLENPRRGVWKINEAGKKYLHSKGHIRSTFAGEKLIEIMSKIISDLRASGKRSFTIKELYNLYQWQGLNYNIEQIENALNFLSTPPITIIKREEEKHFVSDDMNAIIKKMDLLLQVFNRIKKITEY